LLARSLLLSLSFLPLPFSHRGERAAVVVAPDRSGDFTDIQRAIDSLPPSGGMVFVKAGVYIVKQTIRLPSNVTLCGEGTATVLKASEEIGRNHFPNNRVIRNADHERGNTGIVIRDLVVDGGLLGEYHKTGIYGISLENCDNCRIEGVTVRRCSGEGILVAYGGGSVVVKGCVVEENNHGINVHHTSGPVLLSENICRRNGVHKPQYGGIGIFCEAASNLTIEGNLCLENAWAGIVWMGGADEERGIRYPAHDALISGNLCLRNGSQGGIFINGTYAPTERFLVVGNLCKENGRDGIWAFKAKEGVICANLCVSNNWPGGIPGKAEGELLDWQVTASGIRLTDCESVVVVGNRCLDVRPKKFQVYGICEEGRSKGNAFWGNMVEGNLREGMKLLFPLPIGLYFNP